MDKMVRELQHKGDEPHLLREVMRVHQALLNVFSRRVGMPASRLALMRVLAESNSEDIGIMDIARSMGVDAAAVTRQVKEMESEGLVERHPDAKDGRRRYVKITERGFRFFEQIHRRAHEFERELGSLASSEDIAAALRVLSQLRGALEGLR
jgi:DNA-binding MarR family transcriptional regulator